MIDAQRMRRLEELFRLARGLPADQRAAFPARHVPDDEGLRAELAGLLAEDERSGELLSGPLVLAGDDGADGDDGDDEAERVGRYALLERIGEGGMGVVYRARQEDPVVREVALKILHAGEESPEGIARFEAERQALALMDHPGIARIFDGGTTARGRPYLVMELVRGRPLAELCAGAGLSLRARLQLFVHVCEAVQHAHQKGVIHRDLKPSNVLVTRLEGEPVPKLIDFGVACSVEGEGDETLPGSSSGAAGSLAYMSPEQASGGVADTRSDVYALGCMLIEVVGGAPPLDTTSLRGLDPEEARARVSGGCRPDPVELGLPGELAHVARRAMARDARGRYPTAEALAEDVRRYLDGRPVSAAPATLGYTLRKLVARYRIVSAAFVAAVLAIIAAIAGLSMGIAESGRRQREAESARGVEADLRGAAELEAARRSRALTFVLGMIEGGDLSRVAGPDLTVRALLATGGEGIAQAFTGDPGSEIQVRRSLGHALYMLGDLDRAREHLRRVQVLEEADPSTQLLARYQTLSSLMRIAGDSDGEPDFDFESRVITLAQVLIEQESAEVGVEFGRLFEDYGDFRDDAAQEHFARIRSIAPASLSLDNPVWPVLADFWEDFGSRLTVSELRGDWIPLLREAVRIREALDQGGGQLARSRGLLVEALLLHGSHAEAEGLVVDVIAELERTLPTGHWRLAEARSLLGSALSGHPQADALEEAGRLLTESREQLVVLRGVHSRPAVAATARWVEHLARVGDEDLQASRSILARALARAPNPPDQWGPQALCFESSDAALMGAMALIAAEVLRVPRAGGELGDPEAFGVALDVVARELGRLPADSYRALVVGRQLGTWAFPLEGVGVGLERKLIATSLTVLRPAARALPLEVSIVLERLGRLELLEGNAQEAAELAAEGLTVLGSGPSEEGLSYLTLRLLAARADAELGRPERALEDLQDLLGRARAVFGVDSHFLLEVQGAMAEVRGAG